MTTAALSSSRFYGWRVVAAAFVLAIFGWGIGFYGPPVFLMHGFFTEHLYARLEALRLKTAATEPPPA